MPRVGFTPDNKQQSAADYPKLQLQTGERARVVAIESEPLFEYTHTLRAPHLVDGKPVYERVSKFGKEVDELKTDFVGKHICIGDYTVIEEKGVDVKGCPVCRASKETDAVKPPERRFAMHVVQYTTQPGGFTIQEPFAVSLKAWAFSNKVFDTIVDHAAEWGDLKTHDLLLGPCKSKQYQNFDIAVASKAEWLANEERKQLVVRTYKENQSKDLSSLIARKISREYVEEDLEKVLRAYRQAFGKGAPEEVAPEVEVAANLDGLLGDEGKSHTVPQQQVSELDDLLGERVPQGEAAAPAPAVEGGEFDLEDLLSDV